MGELSESIYNDGYLEQAQRGLTASHGEYRLVFGESDGDAVYPT